MMMMMMMIIIIIIITPWSKGLLEKLTVSQLVKKFPHFMEPGGSLPHSQEPATCLYPEPAQSIIIIIIIIIIFLGRCVVFIFNKGRGSILAEISL
jgi:hypothetical protein